ncbi:5-(carboxyamino)imidazole ribonucleotide synthase [Salimicrobium salexigens]|uniref:N5-carboxyaminoimidazole ribonucleotide synthase n=1 Tax=Salimicrobium salexigens TaxID=908941 RepID=A0ABY1KXA2_9BACI|nr:5-(carboxyamino)imidazole ribonucleotide synthase [Salimicrobium salexigens]SIS76031.1 5-(carboxyamino)imidazole ribonucleotide synthase [Salimicrobium salexigens]
MNVIEPGGTIGILGGGQLGRMMATAAKHMGYRIAVLDPAEDCPAAQVADIHVKGKYDDLEAAGELGLHSDVVTYEFENVDERVSQFFENEGKLPQGTLPLAVSQNRGKEKEFAEKAGIHVPAYRIVQTGEEFDRAVTDIGLPAVMKTVSGGYDGKGQYLLRSPEDCSSAREDIWDGKYDGKYIVEKWVDIDKEVSQVFTRDSAGDISFFPVAENVHKDQVLFTTTVPASISDNETREIRKRTEALAKELGVVGTFAVEWFVSGEDVYFNEMAPRPHNSGHYTIEACSVSQFEQHIRAICGLPLLPVHTFPAAKMINVLGRHRDDLFQSLGSEQVHVHDYGKHESRPQRKMGHVTIIGSSPDDIKLGEPAWSKSW